MSAFPPSGTAFPNLGHPGAGQLARVRVSADARAAYEALVRDSVLPNGSIVALFHENPSGAGGPVFVMQKHDATWTYIELASDGVLMNGAPNCAGCHAAGVGDSLFGLPRPKHGAP